MSLTDLTRSDHKTSQQINRELDTALAHGSMHRLVRMRWLRVAAFLTVPIWGVPYILGYALWQMWKDFSEAWNETFGAS
jgi:hypothetical protein